MIATDSTQAIKPAKTGRLLSGTISTNTAKQPANSPANPRPVTALPAMNMVDEIVVAQSKDPTRNMELLNKKMALIEKSLYSFANPNWKAQVHSRNADAYHPTSAEVWKWFVILGTAVATILTSKPPRTMIIHNATTVNQNLEPVGYSGSPVAAVVASILNVSMFDRVTESGGVKIVTGASCSREGSAASVMVEVAIS